MDLSSPSRVFAIILLLALAQRCTSRAQFNLFPSNWNSGGNDLLFPNADESNRPPGSGCFTLLDVATHGSPDCPRDFDHQMFDTHTCRFVCMTEINQGPSLYDQNGVVGGDKPRSRLP